MNGWRLCATSHNRSGKYVLVTAYYKKPNLRFVVYVSESSSKYELTCVHKDISDKETHDLDPDLIKVYFFSFLFLVNGDALIGHCTGGSIVSFLRLRMCCCRWSHMALALMLLGG